MRKLASIRKISKLVPIENADLIELAYVDGWKVIVKKGEHSIGDNVIYLEIDSWVPHEIAPFLSKGKSPKEYMGIKGERLKTISLKGQVSQGLILPTKIFGPNSEIIYRDERYYLKNNSYQLDIGELDNFLNIIKWEPPIDPNLNCNHIGHRPCYLPKSDQERIQNIYSKYSKLYKNDSFEATLKLDGASCIVFLKLDENKEPYTSVCSRNFELKYNEYSVFFSTTQEISEKILFLYKKTNKKFAFYGEIIGHNIQGNKELIKGQKFYIYDIYDIDSGNYLTPSARKNYLLEIDYYNNNFHVPVLDEECYLFKETNSIEQILEKSNIPSLKGPIGEGIVYKHTLKPSISFKALNNKYLLKYNE